MCTELAERPSQVKTWGRWRCSQGIWEKFETSDEEVKKAIVGYKIVYGVRHDGDVMDEYR